MNNKHLTKIIIIGTAGNGIRFMARKFLELLSAHDKKLYITYYFGYDSTVRGGNTIAYITIAKDKEPNGYIFNDCDILLTFRENKLKKFKAKKYIGRVYKRGNHIEFEELSSKHFKNPIHANMIALGYLAHILNIKNAKLSLDPTNTKAFNLGFNLAK